MSKIIAVCGSPNSGKTTFSLKLAQSIYFKEEKSVIYLSPDLEVPTLGYIFPHCKESDLYSLGTVLDKTDVFPEDVMKCIVTVKTMKNFGYLGYKAGENKYSYPRPTEDKIISLFNCLRDIADYIIIDCSKDVISNMALSEADSIIQMITPDIKSMVYYISHKDKYDTLNGKSIKLINILDRDIYLPINDVKDYFKEIKSIIPYSQPLKQQSITGTLSERIPDGKYRNIISGVIKAVI